MNRLCAIVLSAEIVLTHVAYGQAPDTEAEHQRGMALRDAHRDEEARSIFQTLYTMTHEPRALVRMALAEAAMGRWADADEHIDIALMSARDPWIRSNRRDILRNQELVRRRVGRLMILCTTPGAAVYTGGVERASIPLPEPLRFSEGDNELEVRAPGHLPLRQLVTVRAGSVTQVVMVLTPAPPPPPPPPPPPDPIAPCAPLPLSDDPPITESATTEPVPAALGGELRDGVYILTAMLWHAPTTLSERRTVLRISGNNFTLSFARGGEAPRMLGGDIARTSGGEVRLRATCPQAAVLEYDRFTATPTGLTLLSTVQRKQAFFRRVSPRR